MGLYEETKDREELPEFTGGGYDGDANKPERELSFTDAVMTTPAPMPKVAGKEDEPDNEPFAPLPADAPAPTVTPAAKVALGDKATMRDRLADALAERANRNKGGGLAGILARAGEGVNAAVAHRKADYSFGDAVDAREQAWRDEPVLLAQRQTAMDDKRKVEERQRLVDDLNRRFKESQIAAPADRLKEIEARGVQDRLTQDAKPLSMVFPPAPREEIPRKTMKMLEDESDALVKARLAAAARAGGKDGSGGDTAGLTPGQVATNTRHIEDQKYKSREKLAKQVSEHDDIGALLKGIEAEAPGSIYGDAANLPGWWDRTAAKVSDGAIGSDKAASLLGLQTRLKSFIGKELSGMALNETELRNINTFMGTSGLAPPKMMANALNITRKHLHTKIAGRKAQFSEGPYAVYDEYMNAPENARIIRTDDPVLFRDMPSAPSKGPPVTAPIATLTKGLDTNLGAAPVPTPPFDKASAKPGKNYTVTIKGKPTVLKFVGLDAQGKAEFDDP